MLESTYAETDLLQNYIKIPVWNKFIRYTKEMRVCLILSKMIYHQINVDIEERLSYYVETQ